MTKTNFSRVLALLAVVAVGCAPIWADHSPAPDTDFGLQFRLGGYFLTGDGEFWEDAESTFTIDASDFDDAMLGLSFVSAFGNHLEAGFNVDVYDRTVTSAVRGFVDSDGFSIFHDTTLTLVPLTADVRVIPAGRYRMRPGDRRVRQPVFYLGGGAGITLWEYEEVGDFVDFTDDSIFFDRFNDRGVAFELHVLAGLELPVSSDWGFLFEARHSWVDDEPGGDFAGLGELDLGGTSAFVGAAVRF